jgi:glycosyltransferase involved in cell wall biosynthesis
MYGSLRDPLVSIAIINWNYGRFVGDAIRSVKEQTYKNIQCIILDNGSTDNSSEIIEEAIAADPKFAFFRVQENLGHLGGALWLLDHLTGDFVTFLDADDVLLPDYVATHVQAHLMTGISTGFTSADIIAINAAGVIQSSGSSTMYDRWTISEPCSRENSRTPRLAAIGDKAFLAISNATRFLPPHLRTWAWSPGSSNMFRRALLCRVRPYGLGPTVFGGVDTYFLPLLHAISGTLLINLPLSLYRIHGANDYTTLPSIYGVRTGTDVADAQADTVVLLALDFLISDIDTALLTVPAYRYWSIFDGVAAIGHQDMLSHPKTKALFTKNFNRLAAIFGRRQVVQELRRRIKFKDLLDILIAIGDGQIRLSDLRICIALEMRHRLRKFAVGMRHQLRKFLVAGASP